MDRKTKRKAVAGGALLELKAFNFIKWKGRFCTLKKKAIRGFVNGFPLLVTSPNGGRILMPMISNILLS